MADFAQVKNLITGFLQSSGRDPSQADFGEENYCAINDDEGNVMHLSFDPDAGTLVLMGALGKLPEAEAQTEDSAELTEEAELENQHDTFRVLKFFLGCNLLWDDSQGATFASVEEDNYLVLQRKFSLEGLSQQSFNTTVLAFFEELKLWISRYALVLEQVENGVPTNSLDLVFA